MKDIVITLKKDALMYSIDYMTYKVAKVHFSELILILTLPNLCTSAVRCYDQNRKKAGRHHV